MHQFNRLDLAIAGAEVKYCVRWKRECGILLKFALQFDLIGNERKPSDKQSLKGIFGAVRVLSRLKKFFALLDEL